jgi:hypothetical protein
MQTDDPHSKVAEIQGLYGPLQILEGKVQQIWALQQIQRGEWRSRSGARVRIRQPGHWNRGAGPDFLEAVIELDGEVRMGDVELHLYREDWWRHGHHLDPAYDSVVLHAVLFAGGLEREIRTCGGRRIEEWVLGPWLREDLESVAGGEPGLYGELAPELREWMEADPPEQIRQRLKIGADRRWQDKESMARCLLREQGWKQGLHLMILFYLGYPFNRQAFYAMGEAHPPEDWRHPGLLDLVKETWSRSVRWNVGRPANRAGRRLAAYHDLNRLVPDWFERLTALPRGLLPAATAGSGAALPEWQTAEIRREWKFTQWRRWLQREVFGDAFSESLVDRLWIDVCLPILVAGEHIPPAVGAELWFHARGGNFPDAYRSLLKVAGIHLREGYPVCNGWLQGLVWIDDQLRLERIRSSLGQAPASKRCLTS